MRKTKKTLAILAIVAMVFTMIPMQVFAATGVPTRISGTTQYDTAVAIAEQGYAAGSDNVVLAPGMKANLSDALASGPLAATLNAPILLTEGNALTTATKAELTKLKAKTVYVTSGTSVIKPAVIDELTAMGITVKNVWGQTASDTSVAIAKAMGVTFTQVALANGAVGAQDALSIASIASAQKFPILITDNNASLPQSIVAYLATLSITKSFVVGGTSVISDNQMAQLTGAVRSAGNDAYDTNVQVIKDFAASVKYTNVFVANGETLVDALAGAPLAAKYNAVIVLTDGVNAKAAATVNALLKADSVITAFGGEAVVPAATLAGVAYTAPAALSVVSVSAINATQLSVVFNQAVSLASVFTDGKSGAFLGTTVAVNTLDSLGSGALTGSLSADGLTLTITAASELSKRYDVVIDAFKAITGKTMTKYNQMITIVKDATAPTIVSTTQASAFVYKVTFSEPMNSLGTVTYTSPSGPVVGLGYTLPSNVATFDLSGITINGAAVVPGQVVTATFIGAQDKASNLLTPNPATVTFTVGAKDGVKPTVSSFTQTGAYTLAVKFSEALIAVPTVSVAGGVGATVVVDATDSTKYNVTNGALLDGPMVVAVSAFIDLSSEAGANMTQVVNFVKDVVAPSVVSSVVAIDPTDLKEYLEMTFDKDVTLAAPTITAGAGSIYTKDYITTAVATAPITVAYKNSTDKKIVRVALATLLATQDVKDAAYTLKLAIAGISSGAGVAANTPVTASFTRGLDGVAANANTLAVVGAVAQGADNNKVTVTFDKAVDGASATTVGNYSIAGAVITSVTLLPAAGTQTAILNLQAGSNLFTGVRNISISNVKASGSTVVMTPYFSSNVSLNENVAPTIASAKLTDLNKVTLTFSEAVSNTLLDTNDFELYIGGVKVASNDVVSTPVTAALTTVVLTLEDSVTVANITAGLTLKSLATLNIVDVAGNKVSVPSTGIVVTQ